ncbi:MAG: ComEC/Rec2 family competence protein, partial [Crocinitomicaceae bacterium]|nr:ComEC/Rec2 family competence protein [Crocinitomicaceae bacterium]
MKFFKTPFVFIVPLFCLGILFGESEVFFMLVSVATVLISLILLFLYFFRRSFQTLFLPFAIVSIVLLGILSFKGSVWSNGRLVDEYGGAEASILVDVVEISNSNKEWRKAVCNVIATIDEKELVPRSERIVIYFNSEVVEVRDRLLIVSRLFPIRNKGNLGEFDQETYWKFKGVTAMAFINDFDLFFLSKQKATLFDQSRELISAYLNSVLENHLSKNNQAIARALILGDKSQLDPEVKKSFSSAGAMHVLAVSGLHVGIILEIFLFLFGRFPKLVSKQVALIISLLLIWGYAGVIGFPASVVRASLMFSILVLGRQFSRDSNGLNTLLFSCFLMLCIDPMWLFDLGFQLSFFAMMGIILLSKPLTQTFYIRNKIILRLWEGTCVGLSAQLFTLPITLYYFHQFPNYFL